MQAHAFSKELAVADNGEIYTNSLKSCPERSWMPHHWRCSKPGWGPEQPSPVLDKEVGGPDSVRGVGT